MAEGFDRLPSYRDLRDRPGVPAGSAWGIFGADDRVGTINLLTASRVVEAAGLVRKGAVFPLDLPVGTIEPGLFGRVTPRHHVIAFPNGAAFDDYLDGFYLQGSSQWDALRHIRSEAGFYNGTSDVAVGEAGQLGIDSIAQRGIVGRGLLLDVAAHLSRDGEPFDASAALVITPEMLDECAAAQGSEVRSGDVLLVRTGWLRWYLDTTDEVRAGLAADPASIAGPGIGPGDAVAEWLWDHQVAAAASDNVALEPPGAGELHSTLIPLLGMTIGELWNLDDLAADCAGDGVYECLLTSAPLHVVGGVGSPANALAIK